MRNYFAVKGFKIDCVEFTSNEKLNLRHEVGLEYYKYNNCSQDEFIISIDGLSKNIFLAICQNNNMNAREITNDEWLIEAIDSTTIYTPGVLQEIELKKQINIIEINIDEIICGPRETQILLEHTVTSKTKLKLYINSNEITGHNIPHCHVHYKDIKNYCVLSLVDLEMIAPEKNKSNAIIKEARDLLNLNLQDARKIWNEIHSVVGFEKDSNGKYTDKLIKKE